MLFDSPEEMMRYVKEQSDTVILSFSRGKDSIAAWIKLKEYGLKVIPVHMYTVPGISFVDESLRYYEKAFKTKIYDMPHPAFYRQLRNFIFQAPQNLRIIEEWNPQSFEYDDLFALVKYAAGVPQETFTAVGVTQNDSLTRRATISKYGPLNESRRQFYPIYDWSKRNIVDAITEAKVQLPIDYRMFGRSWDGLDYRFIVKIKKYFPDDYAKIVEVFPLVEIEILRYEWRAKHLKEKKGVVN